jgi:multiple sugar transport system substrate-binding protein
VKVLRVAICVLLMVLTGALVVYAKTTVRYETVSVWVPLQEEAIKEFNETHPEIKVEMEGFPWTGAFERLLTHFTAGTAPDVVALHSDWVHRFASLNFLLGLNPYLPEIGIEDFWPDMVKHFTYKDELYAIPSYGDVWGLAYNVDLYKEAGLDPEKPPQSWEEELEHFKLLTKPEENQYGFGLFAKGGVHELASLINTYIYQNGGKVLSDDYTKCLLGEPEAIEAIQFVADLYLKHKVCLPGALEYEMKDIDKIFANGGVAVFPTAASHIPFIYQVNPNINFYSAPMPGRKTWKGARMYGWSLAISSKSKHPQEAWEFVKFMNSPEMSKKLWIEKIGTAGPRMSVAKEHPRLSQQPYKGFIEAMLKGYGVLNPPIEEWQQIVMKEVDAFQKVLLEQQTVEEAVQDLVSEINEILAERK